jgi:sulfur relay (sulfurtransferase) complex TusBCD TusD component (DsrE family)
MASYLLIETRDPFDSADTRHSYELARGLAEQNSPVTVFLAQNGVLAARRSSSAGPALAQLVARTTVLADDFSLRERGIGHDELADGVQPAGVDRLVELLMSEDCRGIWH